MDREVLTKLKIIMLGESDVGKSSLLLSFTDDDFSPGQTCATIGIDCKSKELTTLDGNTVKLSLWDTAGQERLRTPALTPAFYRYLNLTVGYIFSRNAHGAFLVFDVNNYDSFTKLDKWLIELKTHSTKDNIVKMVVGNKTDNVDCREVTIDEALYFTKKHKFLYMEVSAKTGFGVQIALKELVYTILQTPDLFESDNQDNNIIRIGQNEVPRKPTFCERFCSLI